MCNRTPNRLCLGVGGGDVKIGKSKGIKLGCRPGNGLPKDDLNLNLNEKLRKHKGANKFKSANHRAEKKVGGCRLPGK